MSSTTRKIGLLTGSFRSINNNAGVAAWVATRFGQLQAAGISLEIIDTTKPPFPLGPVRDAIIPAAIASGDYPSASVKDWSSLVRSLSGLIIVSPEYNAGYPGDLKNALDQIYHEWKGLPVAVVTYGGMGGARAGLQLRQVLESGIFVKLVSQGEVEIHIPKEYRGGGAVVKPEDEFLTAYEGAADGVLQKLVEEVLSATR